MDGYLEIISKASPNIQQLANQAKAVIVDTFTDVVEVPWPKQKIIGYGVGPKKMSEQFCYIGVFMNHINLGFYYGADLPDPEKLLQGTGKMLRHIKIFHIDQLDDPALRALVEAASKHLPKIKSG